MLLPSFSLRAALQWLTLFALFCLVLASASQGNLWAIAASGAVIAVGVILFTHAFFYWGVSLFARMLGREQLPAQTRQGGIQLSPDTHLLPQAAPRESDN